MSNFRHRLTALALFVPAVLIVPGTMLPQAARADGEEAAPAKSDEASENFDKTKRFIPGEEVVTTTGKKVKVWSTEGPVPVSQPPQPFQDQIDQHLPPNTNIVVDPEILERRREGGGAPSNSPSDRPPTGERGGDSFDVNR